MLIELSDAVYETFFRHVQTEITGVCNMKCRHCRAWRKASVHMPMDVVRKILKFAKANADNNFSLTISGGEPFLYPFLVDVVKTAHDMEIDDIIITTNGSVVKDSMLAELKGIGVYNLCIQVSIDSPYADYHDEFRGYKGAFEKAVSCLRRVGEAGLFSSLRATFSPRTLYQMGELIKLAKDCGAGRVSIGSVIPVGRGAENMELLLSPNQKKRFLENLAIEKRLNADIDIITEDPLKFALPNCPWRHDSQNITDPAFFGGCTAGVAGFNADSEGTITPCAVLLKPIVNVVGKTVEEISRAYVENDTIKALVARLYSGKCGSCCLKRICGGCRAVAEGVNGDYLSSDATCWLGLD